MIKSRMMFVPHSMKVRKMVQMF